MELEKNEKVEDLQFNNLKIIQNKKWFCFGMDSVLISNFAKNIKNNAKVADLGSGTGIIAVLLSGKTKAKKIYCVEKQPEMAQILNKNIELNNLQDKLEVINKDIMELELKPVDAVVMNPPYKKANTGIKNENKQKFISKFETTATLSDFVGVAKKILKDGGKLFIVHRPERLVDVISSLRENNLEPKRIQFVYSHEHSEENAKLFLLEAVKNAKPFMKVEKSIYVYNENGEYTDEIYKIYKGEM